jgi:adhesin transport system outer membrane protein
MRRAFKLLIVIIIFGAGFKAAWSAEPFSITDAINQAVKTNPGVGEAAANRRATEAELQARCQRRPGDAESVYHPAAGQ